MKLTKTSTKNRLGAVALIALIVSLLLTLLGHERAAFAQAGFEGDYDLSFGGGDGYYVDPEDVDPTVDDYQTVFRAGELLPNGSIIAGGYHLVTFDGTKDFYLRKFTPTGGGIAGSIATAGTDYVAVPLTTLTFTPGQTAKTVTVQVKGDTVHEANETFFVNLSGALNAAITDAKGLGTILNDD